MLSHSTQTGVCSPREIEHPASTMLLPGLTSSLCQQAAIIRWVSLPKDAFLPLETTAEDSAKPHPGVTLLPLRAALHTPSHFALMDPS